MNTDLELVNQSLASYDAVAAGLEELRKEFGGVLYPVETTKGLDAAKAARSIVREKRFEVERVRASAKAPILQLGKFVDARAKEITEEILGIENPIDAQIKSEERRKEEEKQARIAAEQRRVQAIQDRIAEIRTTGLRLAAGASALEIQEAQQKLRALEIDESFEEFRPQALAAKGEACIALAALGEAALVRESEKAELERFRAEKAARDAIEAALPPSAKAQPPPAVLATTVIPAGSVTAQTAAPFALEPAPPGTTYAPSPKPDWTQERPTDQQIIEAVAFTFSVTNGIALTWIKQVGRGKKVK